MWFIGVEVEQETSASPPKKNPGSAPVSLFQYSLMFSIVWFKNKICDLRTGGTKQTKLIIAFP